MTRHCATCGYTTDFVRDGQIFVCSGCGNEAGFGDKATDETPPLPPVAEAIKTVRSVHGLGHAELVKHHLFTHRALQCVPSEDPGSVDFDDPVYARVDFGRWVIDCGHCAGAELADTGDLRFFCLSCNNLHNGCRYRRVIMPRNRAAIEAALLERPENARHWRHGETLQDVKTANLLHSTW
jgi:hypothetical protein